MTKFTNKKMAERAMRTVGFFAAATLIFSLTPWTNAEESPHSPVIMEGADVLVVTDLAKIRNSSISKELEKMQKETGQSAKASFKIEKYEELGKELQKTTGLEEKDFKTFTLAAKLSDLDLTNKADIQKLNVAFALTLDKPLTLDKLEESLRKAADASEDVDTSAFKRTSIGEHEVLAVTNDEANNTLNKLLFTSAQDNKTILGGTSAGLKSALSRIDNDSILSVQEEFGGWPEKAPHIGLLFNPTSEMLAKAKKQLESTQQKKQGQAQNRTKVAFIEILPHIKRLVLAVDCTDKMYFTLHSLMDSAQQAQKLTSLLKQPVISMTQATLTMVSGGKRLDLAQSLNAKVADNTRSVLSFQLSQNDLKTLQKMNKKMQQGRNSKSGKKSEKPSLDITP